MNSGRAMAETADKIPLDETGHWLYIILSLNVLKFIICNVLRIVFYLVAFIMLKCSSLFKMLSEKLKTAETAENLAEKFMKNRCNKNFPSNCDDVNEQQKEVNQAYTDMIKNESLQALCDNSSFDYNNKSDNRHLEKIEVNNYVIDSVNKPFNLHPITQMHKKMVDENLNSGDNEENIKNMSNSKTNICEVKMEHNTNFEVNEYKVEQMYNSEVSADKLENNSDPEINEENFEYNDNEVDIFDDALSQKYNEVDVYGDALGEKSKCYILEENILDQKTIAMGHNILKKQSMRPAMALITKTLKENVEKQKKQILEDVNRKRKIELERKYKKKMEDLKHNQNVELEDEKLKKSLELEKQPHIELESKLNKSNEAVDVGNFHQKIENKNLEVVDNINTNGILNKSQEINKNCEKIHYVNKHEKLSTNYKRNLHEDFYGKRKSINMNKKHLNIVEKDEDIFSLPSEFSLAICVTEDLQLSMGIAPDFKLKFGSIGHLMDQKLKLGDVGEIVYNGQYIFYLVAKEKYGMSDVLSKVLRNLLNKMEILKLTKLAIHKNGFDRIPLRVALELTSRIFEKSNIEITLCLSESKLDVEQTISPKVHSTAKQLWDMEAQTDRIMFINMNDMYLNNWTDNVIDHIDSIYPFKYSLLEDINIKPMAPGDVLSYNVNGELLFCIFIKPIDQNPSYFKCLEKAYREIKSQITGYRYLGIQSEPVNYRSISNIMAPHVLLLQSVFNNLNAEIWVCDDSDFSKAYQLNQYNKFVNANIEGYKKGNLVVKSKFTMEKKKYNNDYSSGTYYSVIENGYYKHDKHSNNHISSSGSKTTNPDNYETKNSDNN